jgi:hypothetical protein
MFVSMPGLMQRKGKLPKCSDVFIRKLKELQRQAYSAVHRLGQVKCVQDGTRHYALFERVYPAASCQGSGLERSQCWKRPRLVVRSAGLACWLSRHNCRIR